MKRQNINGFTIGNPARRNIEVVTVNRIPRTIAYSKGIKNIFRFEW